MQIILVRLEFKRATLQRQQHLLYDLLDTYQSIGSLYNYQNEYDLSLSYFEKAITLSDSLHIEIYKVQIYTSIVRRIKGRVLLGRWFKKKDVDVPMGNM